MRTPTRLGALTLLGVLGMSHLARGDPAQPCALPDAGSPAAASIPVEVGKALFEEAKRYANDAGALVTNPIRWDETDLRKFALFGFTLGGLYLADQQIYVAVQKARGDFTDHVSNATTDFGGPWAYAISGGLIVGGLIAKDANIRDTGREALEAAVLAGVITTVLKEIFGRERPYVTDGETVLAPFSGNTSFPSGHATTAFAVASVIAMRTDGWIVPTVAYTLATLVAMDRVNDQAHFASDVFAGAAIGLTTGRFLVNRHRRQAAAERRAAEFEIVPIRDGLALHVSF